MKIVYITTVSQHAPVRGRVYEAFCEYDPDLLEAHKIANEMAEIMEVNLSDLRYCIGENKSPFGAILSYNENNLYEDRIEDKRLQRIGSDLFCPMVDSRTEWHKFYDMDVSSYENLLYQGEEKVISELEEDIF